MTAGLLDLTGARVVVTGGSRGIGAACCRLFAQAGATVLIHYHTRGDQAVEVLSDLRRLSDQPHALFRADLTQPAEVLHLFAFVGDQWGHLDCLVNNAGIWVQNPLERFDFVRYQETLDLNLLGPFLAMTEAVPLLKRSPNASVVNVTSTAGQRGEAFYSPYAASKGALISATKAWSTELAPTIRVNSVAPGWVDTEMSAEALAGESGARARAGIPLGRVATAEDVAGPVVFLASPLARHITGEILNVNGGSVLVG